LIATVQQHSAKKEYVNSQQRMNRDRHSTTAFG
jgi:hypothetical protein